ncbi:MAG: paraquat-inducible protein A [Gammaproteobacteria bacterium]
MIRRIATETVACPDCDLLQRIPPLPSGGKARCPRCGKTLATQPFNPIDRPLALTLAAAIVFIIANVTPLMGLAVVGREASTTLIGGAHQMWLQGREITAVMVAFCTVIAPGGYILFMFTVLLALRRPPAPHWVGQLLRWADLMRPWSMNEVMMLGILVALFKIAQLATVIPDIGMFAVFVLIVLLAAISGSFDPREVWKRVEWADGRLPPRTSDAGAAR